jgi:hypothetical protein
LTASTLSRSFEAAAGIVGRTRAWAHGRSKGQRPHLYANGNDEFVWHLCCLLWGGLSYHRPQVGGRVKGAFCQIGVKRGHVRLDFIHGIRLADPCGVLQEHRLSKRFVPISTVADTERPEIADLIREAEALDPAQWT